MSLGVKVRRNKRSLLSLGKHVGFQDGVNLGINSSAKQHADYAKSYSLPFIRAKASIGSRNISQPHLLLSSEISPRETRYVVVILADNCLLLSVIRGFDAVNQNKIWKVKVSSSGPKGSCTRYVHFDEKLNAQINNTVLFPMYIDVAISTM